MKIKFLLVSGLLLAAGSVLAQKNTQQFEMQVNPNFSVFTSEKALDTVTLPPISQPCIPNAGIGLLTSNGVHVAGTNGFNDKEKAQLLRYAGGGNITGVLAGIALKWEGAVQGTTNYNAVLYSATNNGPGSVLGTSQPVAYSAIDTVSDLTLFSFSSPIAVTDSFYASLIVDNGTAGTDSVALLVVFDATNPTNVCGLGTGWEKQSDNSWHPMNGTLQTEWGADVQFLIGAIIDVQNLGIPSNSPFNTYRVFPNPAKDFVNLSYSLNQPGDVKISMTDMTGKIVYTQLQASQYPGAYNQMVDINSFATGVYVYTISAGESSVTGKLVIQH